MNIEHIILLIKNEISKYIESESIQFEFADCANIQLLELDEFLSLSGSQSLGEGPGAFYNSKNNTIYMLKKENYSSNDMHKMIHEILHSLSNHYTNNGKEGYMVFGYDENNKLISAGGTLNEAATEYITSIINHDEFIGYPDDMKYVFELFIDILNIRKDFISLYFQRDNWLNDEMNNKFNSKLPNQLDEFVLEFDNRLPMYRKNKYDFNKVVEIVINAIIAKITNHENINYKGIYHNLLHIKNCNFDLNEKNIQSINYTISNLESIYGKDFFAQANYDNDGYEGKIRLGR